MPSSSDQPPAQEHAEGTTPHVASVDSPSVPVSSGEVRRAMEIAQVQTCLRALLTVEEDDAPTISAYLPVPETRPAGLNERRIQELRKLFPSEKLDLLDGPLDQLAHFYTHELHCSSRGAAVFARGGSHPFFIALPLSVPVPERLSFGPTPDVYQLVELKDSFHRYIIAIATDYSTRILQVNVGPITRQVWAERPKLRERIGRGWTREHYQDHRWEGSSRFLAEKVQLLEQLTAARDNTHLVLAGEAQRVARLRAALPQAVLDKVVDLAAAPLNARTLQVVEATVAWFVQHEIVSPDPISELLGAVERAGPVVLGTSAVVESLRSRRADMLVMLRQYQPGPGWGCPHCGWLDACAARPRACGGCQCDDMQPQNLDTLMLKLATEQALKVQLVRESEPLAALGGVGCLLRHATPPA